MTDEATPTDDPTTATDDPVTAPDAPMPDMPRDPTRTRGRYRYTRDGAAVGVDETFVLGDVADGAVRVRSTRVTARPTARLEADARITPDGVAARLRWTGSGPGLARDAVADYVARDGGSVVSASVDGVARPEARAHGALYPLMRVFTGPLVLASARELEVVVPDVADPTALDRFLAPTTTRRRAERLGARDVVVDGEPRAGTAYRWTGGAYGEDGADFVVDDGGLLLAYSVVQPSGRWDVVLAEVVGPWPVPLAWPAGWPPRR